MTASCKTERTASFFDQVKGEVGRRVRHLDWGTTPLGDVEGWTPALRHAARLVLNTSLPMTLTWGPEFIQIYNEGYLDILGDKHPGALGRPVEEVYPEIWDKIGPILQSVFQTGEAVWFEDLCLPIARQGFAEEMYFTFSYSPVYDDTGEVVGVLSSAVETTESVLARRRIEVLRELAAVSSRATLAEMIDAAILCLQEAVNDLPMCAVWGIEAQRRKVELLASTGVHEASLPTCELMADVIPWQRLDTDFGFIELPSRVVASLDIHEGRPGVSRVRLIPVMDDTQAGSEGCVAFLAAGVSDQLPFDADYQDFLFDLGRELGCKVADLYYHELQVVEAESRYQAVFEHSVDAMFLTTPKGQMLAANPAACELLGYTEAQLIELTRDDFVDTGDRRVAEFLALSRATGRAQGEFDLIHSSGRKIPCEVTGRRYNDPLGNPRVSLIVRDIRRRLELESNLRQAQKLDIVGKLAGGIAHDFNNLLTVIQSSAQLLEMEVDPSTEAAEDVQIIQTASGRAAAMTRRLLAFSRRQPISKIDLNLAKVIEQLDTVLRSLAGGQNEVVARIEEDPWTVRADQQAIEQILLNLVVNARDAMPNGGRLGISLANVELRKSRRCVMGTAVMPGKYVSLQVSDTGAGIPQDVGLQIFEPFYTTKKEGTGLGLSTVADVVLECGGHIFIESELGEGTSFEVLLPSSTTASFYRAGDEIAAGPRDLSQVRALLVEDQPLYRRTTARMLETVGIDVIAVAAARQAMDEVQKRDVGAFDVVISDVVLPQIGGEEVARRLLEIDADIKVLLISDHCDRAYLRVRPGLEVNVLKKPFNGDELVEAIRTTLRRD